MRITYDKEVDAIYISFQETTVETKELAEGIAADFDSNGLLVGIEILDASERLAFRPPGRYFWLLRATPPQY